MSNELYDQDTVIAFSSCILGSQFTCNDGSCIPLDYKCDMFPDCSQEEDEETCDTLEIPANYQKQVAPTEGSRGIPWPVFVSFEIRYENGDRFNTCSSYFNLF